MTTNTYQNLAQKYYGTRDLSKLSNRQLDKLTNWVTNTNPERDAKQRGRKYSPNTYNKLKKIF
jgi:hypothetical protein